MAKKIKPVSPEMTELIEEYKGLQKKIESMKKEFTKASAAVFASEAQQLFEKFPKLDSFSWTQYTPYFNDGEECVFSAHTDEPHFQFGDDEERDYYYFSEYDHVEDGYENTAWGQRPKYKKVKKTITPEELEKKECYEAVQEFLGNYDETTYELMFGDHVEVVVSKDGVEIDEGISHD